MADVMHQMDDAMAGDVPAVAAGRAGTYLTFALDDTQYGLPVDTVREIIRIIDITPVPQVPPCVKGVINLRGTIVPVVDLRLKLGYAARPYCDRTMIIVIEGAAPAGRTLMGLVVDAASNVLSFGDEAIEGAPRPDGRVRSSYARGVATLAGIPTILLDPDRVLGCDDAACGVDRTACHG